MKEYVFIVTGDFRAGKTSFIHSISDQQHRPVSFIDPKNMIGTWGSVAVRGAVFHFYEPAGNRRFDLMREIVKDDRLAGFIVMMNSTTPATFRDTKSILETFRAYFPATYIVAANFQDSPDAWSVDDLRIALRLPPEISPVPCIATEISSVKNVLLALCDKILEDIEQDNRAEK